MIQYDCNYKASPSRSKSWFRYTLIRTQYYIGIYDNDANGRYLHRTYSDNVLRFVKYN